MGTELGRFRMTVNGIVPAVLRAVTSPTERTGYVSSTMVAVPKVAATPLTVVALTGMSVALTGLLILRRNDSFPPWIPSSWIVTPMVVLKLPAGIVAVPVVVV